MNIVGLISGGKDSIFNLCYSVALGHSVICLAHLSPRGGELETDSYMYQSVGSTVVPAIAECLDLPIIIREIQGIPSQVDLNYEPTDQDETEDLYYLLKDVLKKFPTVNAISCGAILSTYQKIRVENVAKRLNLRVLAYLWQQEQLKLYNQMIDSELSAMIIKTATFGLNKKHIGKMLSTLKSDFIDLYKKYQFHICGEGGEYETLTLDCPIYKKRLEIDDWELVIVTDDKWAPVLIVKPLSWHIVDKFPGYGSKHTELNLHTLQERNIYLNKIPPFSEMDNCRFYFSEYSDFIYDTYNTTLEYNQLRIPDLKVSEHNIPDSEQWKIFIFKPNSSTKQLLDEIQIKIRQIMDIHKVNQVIISFYSPSILNEFYIGAKKMLNNNKPTLITYTHQYQVPAILQLQTVTTNILEIQSSTSPTSISLLTPPTYTDEGFKQFIISNKNESYFSPFFGIVPHTQKLVSREQVSRFLDLHENGTLLIDIMMELLFAWRNLTNFLFLENNFCPDSIPYYLTFIAVDEQFFQATHTKLKIFLQNFIGAEKTGIMNSNKPCFTFLNVSSLPMSANVQILPFFHAYSISKDTPSLECKSYFENEISLFKYYESFQSSRPKSIQPAISSILKSNVTNHFSDINIMKARNNSLFVSLKYDFLPKSSPPMNEILDYILDCIKTCYIEISKPSNVLENFQIREQIHINLALFYTPSLFHQPKLYNSPQDWYNLINNGLSNSFNTQYIYKFSMQNFFVQSLEKDLMLNLRFTFE